MNNIFWEKSIKSGKTGLVISNYLNENELEVKKIFHQTVNKFANLTSLELKTRGKHGNISKGENECPKNWVFIKSKYIKHD